MNKSLICGDNFPNTDFTLRGCVNDANDIYDYLTTYKDFAKDNVKRLLDTECTRSNMLTYLNWLVSDLQEGDKICFFNSSHGSTVQKPDGIHEAICTFDSVVNGINQDLFILDTELHEIFSKVLAGVQCILISDSCFSGGLDKDLNTKSKFIINPANDIPLIRSILVDTYKNLAIPDDNIVLLAASRSDQPSADAFINGRFTGAFKYYLLQTLKDPDYENDILTEILGCTAQDLKDNDFSQIPQIEGKQSLFNEKFF